jgi:outer membrane protein assembly factor BamC
MLNRLMVYLGTEERQARALLTAGQGQAELTQQPRAALSRGADGLAVLAMEDDFSRAWRRVGIALDRTSFTVDDRDRSRGIYYVRYNDPLADTKKKEGLLSKLAFWQDDETGTKGTSYLVRLVTGDGAGTRVVVLDEAGQPERSDTAYRILSLLEEQLK